MASPSDDDAAMDWHAAYVELVEAILDLLKVMNTPVSKTSVMNLPSGPVTMQHTEAQR
jgi:hypothetical protein